VERKGVVLDAVRGFSGTEIPKWEGERRKAVGTCSKSRTFVTPKKSRLFQALVWRVILARAQRGERRREDEATPLSPFCLSLLKVSPERMDILSLGRGAGFFRHEIAGLPNFWPFFPLLFSFFILDICSPADLKSSCRNEFLVKSAE
jgi:hypothetical protein